MEGFLWCHHCGGPHGPETRFCPHTGEAIAQKAAAAATVELIGAGMVIDRKYRILGLIGRGGHSVVYEAMHTMLRQSVALKFLAREPDEKALQRFELEARLTAAITHPNICRSYDMGALESGTRYIVMERLRGEPLHRVLRRQRGLPAELAVHIAQQVLAALGAAHARRVVHRDIKPGNVFLETVPGVELTAKVLDFGIAKVVGHASSIRTTVGHALGTPRYMSPEQLLGRELDGRSDLFAVGVLLYEMLAGRRPFEGASGPEVAAAVLRDTPPPLRSIRPEIPEHLAQIVSQALEKDARARHRSAEAMRRALDVLDGGPISAPPTSEPLACLDDDADRS